MSKLKNTDKIFEDLLDNDFVNVFKPCFFVQRLFGVLGVNMEFKFVTPPTRMYKIYCCVLWLINSLCVVYSVVACATQFDSLSTDIPLKVGMVLNGIAYTIHLWKTVFYKGHARCQLYVKLQKIERTLKMKSARRLNENQHALGWFLVGMSFILYVVWLITFNKYLIEDYCPSATVASVVGTAIFFEIFHVSSILHFISFRVQHVNNKLKQVMKDSHKGIVFSPFDFKAIDDQVGEELVHGMFYVLDSFADTMDIFSHALFVFTFQMLAWQLLTMQNLVVSFKKQMSIDIASFVCTLPSSLVFMLLMLITSSFSQSLMTKLDTCAELCTKLSFSLDEGKSRENTKRITHLLKGKRNPTVFDIFTLDTRLPLHLLGITASYTIVLLQIAAL